MKTTAHFKQLILGLVVPTAVILLWQVMGNMPGMAGILPTPLKVLEGWHSWILQTPAWGSIPTWAHGRPTSSTPPCALSKVLYWLRSLACRWVC